MREFKVFAAISDIHIGIRHIEASDMKAQLKKHFFEVLDKMAYLDAIFITGDVMHTIVSLNSEYSELFYWFIDRVYRVARKRNASVIIIKGTMSHDNDQLNNIKNYVKNTDGVDFRVYDTIEETTLWDNYKVLILPDVRVKQLKDIDDRLIPGKYDLILGHGTIDRMQYVVQESENMPAKAYIYDVEKLMAASKGPVLFGHIHQYHNIQNKFCYVGPFTMLERGWDDAGFVIGAIYDKDHTKFKFEHYINTDSAAYYDIRVTKKILSEIPIDEIIEAIDSIAAEGKPNDLFTLRITRGDDLNAADKVLMLETRYRKDKRFSIIKKIVSKREEDRQKEQADKREQFSYLMDESTDLPIILYTYYNNEVKPIMLAEDPNIVPLTQEDFDRALKRKGR